MWCENQSSHRFLSETQGSGDVFMIWATLSEDM